MSRDFGGSAVSFEKAKTITFALMYLSEALAEEKGKRKLSAKELAAAINKHWKGNIDLGKVSAILRGWHLPSHELDDLLEALQKLIDARNLKLDLSNIPPSLERQYQFPWIFQSNIPHGLQGNEIGDLPSSMTGPWLFYYVSPIDRGGRPESQIRSTAAYIHSAKADARSMDVQMVSRHGLWIGTVFATGPHLYFVLNDIAKNDVRKTETTFFVVNRPHAKMPFIAGIGTALIRGGTSQQVAPVFGFLFFGERQTKLGNSKSDMSSTDSLFDKVFRSSPPTEVDLEKIRSEACLSYSWSEFNQHRPELAAYVRTIEVNGSALDDNAPGLHVRWP